MLNLENYFEKGFEVTSCPLSLMPQFWREIYGVPWKDDPSATYKSMPEWYTPSKKYDIEEDGDQQNLVDRLYGADLLDKAPETLIQLANDIIHTEYFNPLRFLKAKSKLKYIHLWNGAEDVSWHMDSIDSSDTLIFLYLTEEQQWKEEWGGCLGLRKELSTGNYYETKVLPNSGTMVVINNTNPLVKHKVWPLYNTEVNRYIFVMCFTWN